VEEFVGAHPYERLAALTKPKLPGSPYQRNLHKSARSGRLGEGIARPPTASSPEFEARAERYEST